MKFVTGVPVESIKPAVPNLSGFAGGVEGNRATQAAGCHTFASTAQLARGVG